MKQFVLIVFVAIATIGVANRAVAVDTACGPRVARCVLEWYGLRAPDLSETIRLIQSSETHQGASFEQIKGFLQDFGLHAVAIHCRNRDVPSWNEPIILQTTSRDEAQPQSAVFHFVIFIESDDNRSKVIVWDPSLGRRELTYDQFTQLWTGHALLTSKLPIDARWLFGRLFLKKTEMSLFCMLNVGVVILILVAPFLIRRVATSKLIGH